MKDKYYIDKMVQTLDFMALISYGFMVSIMIARNARYAVGWGWTWWDMQQKSIAMWVIIATVKLCLFWKKNVKQSIVATVLLIGVVAGKYLGLNDYIYIVAPMIMFMNVPFERIAKLYACVAGTTLGITIAFSLIGVIPDYYRLIPGREAPVHHLGFSNHNASMAFWLFFCMAMILCVKKVWKRVVVILLEMLISIWLYKMTDSLTSMLLIMFFCITLLFDISLNHFSKSLSDLFRRITGALMVGTPVYALIATFVGVMYYNKIADNPNTLMSRFMLLGRAMESVGIKFPNQTISSNEFLKDVSFNWITGTGKASMGGGDGLYGNLLLKDGLIFLVPYISIQIYIMYKAYRKNAYDILLFQAAIAVFGVLESCAISVQFCVFAFMAFSDWDREDSDILYTENGKRHVTKQDCNKFVTYVISGMLILGFALLSIITLIQVKQFHYIDSNGFDVEETVKVALQEEAFRQIDEEGNLAGVRLYFDKASADQFGKVRVEIGQSNSGQVLLKKEFDVHDIILDEEFGGYYDVVSDNGALYSGNEVFFVDISVEPKIAGKVNLICHPRVVKRLVEQIPNILITWLIFTALSVFLITDIWEIASDALVEKCYIQAENQANSFVVVFLFGLMIFTLAGGNDDSLQESVLKLIFLILIWFSMFILIGFRKQILDVLVFGKLWNNPKLFWAIEGILQFFITFLVMRGITLVRIGTVRQKVVWILMELLVILGMIFFNHMIERKREMYFVFIGIKCVLFPIIVYCIGLYVNDAVSSFGVLVAAWLEFAIYVYHGEFNAVLSKQDSMK